MRHHGAGNSPVWQTRSHAHCVRWSADNRFVIITELGTGPPHRLSLRCGERRDCFAWRGRSSARLRHTALPLSSGQSARLCRERGDVHRQQPQLRRGGRDIRRAGNRDDDRSRAEPQPMLGHKAEPQRPPPLCGQSRPGLIAHFRWTGLGHCPARRYDAQRRTDAARPFVQPFRRAAGCGQSGQRADCGVSLRSGVRRAHPSRPNDRHRQPHSDRVRSLAPCNRCGRPIRPLLNEGRACDGAL